MESDRCNQADPCQESKPHLHLWLEDRAYVFFTIEGYLEAVAFARCKGPNILPPILEITDGGMSEDLNTEDQATLVRMYDELRALQDTPNADDINWF